MKYPKLILESTSLEELQEIVLTALSKAGYQPGHDYKIYPADLSDKEGMPISDEKRFYLDEMAKLNNDLTNMQRQLAKANAELIRLAEIRNRFVGMAAHDLRNPLGIIRSFSEYLKTELKSKIASEQMEIIDTIFSTSVFMQRLVEGMLDFSSIQSGKVVLNLDRHDLNEVFEQSIKLNQILANQHDMHIHFSAAPCELFVEIDVIKIRQVINNLIGNAVKYSPDGTNIYCSLSAEDGFAHVCVRDEGIGISKEDQSAVFEPFKRLSSDQNREKSVGLGLSIVKNIVDAHGGKLTLESEPGKGSTFCFLLPLA